MTSRAKPVDFRKTMRHVLTAGGALLLVAAAGLDSPGTGEWNGIADPVQQVRALTH